MNILATIKTDLGKSIYLSAGQYETVAPQQCMDCGKQSVVVVEGEVDSFGREIVYLCQACLDRCANSQDDWLLAHDVEDRIPRDGYRFIVCESTNNEAGVDWFHRSSSLRRATSYYRRIDEQAACLCGLYPGNGVLEVTIEEAEAMRNRYNTRQRELRSE